LSLFEDLKKKAIKEVDKSAKRIGIKGEWRMVREIQEVHLSS
jgi:hypothetical protein